MLAPSSTSSLAARARFYTVVVLPGAVLMALEIVSSRVLAPQFGTSVYVWGSIIGVFLAAMSVGYVWGGRLADRRPELPHLGALLIVAGLAQTVVLLFGERLVEVFGAWTGGSPRGTLLATTVLFGPPTVLLATVAPYAVKLAARDLSLLGGTAGHLYAISTLGSLGGTLGATFVLIPNLGLASILRLLLLLTLACGVIAIVPRFREQRLVTGLAAGLVVLTASGLIGDRRQEGLLAERMTPYQTLRVTDHGDVRLWRSDGTLHAAIDPVRREPTVQYARVAAAMVLFQPEMSEVLILGMGGGVLGPYLQRHREGLRVDYVEIDPVVPELARQHFFFDDAADPLLTVHVDDARRFLRRGERRWPVIYADTYLGHAIPFHLATVEFFREVERHLSDGGVFALNLVSGPETPFGAAILRSVREAFPRLYLFIVPGGNYLLVATRSRELVTPAELAARAERLQASWSFAEPSLPEIARLHRPIEIDLATGVRLTDDYAPVNHLFFREGAATRLGLPEPESGDR